MSDTNIKERVAAGATFLDETVPNWVGRINTDKLNIRRTCDCVLGQLFGDYNTGTRELEIFDMGEEKTTELGFWGANGEDEEYDGLTRAWLLEIMDRRAAEELPAAEAEEREKVDA